MSCVSDDGHSIIAISMLLQMKVKHLGFPFNGLFFPQNESDKNTLRQNVMDSSWAFKKKTTRSENGNGYKWNVIEGVKFECLNERQIPASCK